MRRKVFSYLFILSIISLLGVSFVSAVDTRSGPLNDLIDGTANVVEKIFVELKPVTDAVLGTKTISSSQNWTEQIIIRLIIIMIVFVLSYTAVKKTGLFEESQRFINIAISIGVSILATRWLAYPGGFLEAVLLPYGAMGLTLASFLPLMIIFFFLEFSFTGVRNTIIRKSAWILFAVFFLFLWLSRYDELNAHSGGIEGSYVLWVYPVTLVLCLIFFWFDGPIQRWITKATTIGRLRTNRNRLRILSLYRELEGLEKAREQGATQVAGVTVSTRVDEIYREIERLSS